MRTSRQVRGAAAENIAVRYLESLGWRVIGRNVKVGQHDEIDIVAMDPGPPNTPVCVEVRSARSAVFGAPEERIDRRKVRSLYRAAREFSKSKLALDLGLDAREMRVDLVVVDMRDTSVKVRHWRALRSD